MPAQVSESLRALNDTFVAEYGDHDVAARKVEEQNKQKNEAAQKTAEQFQQLQVLYGFYMEMQICAERFVQFENTRSGLREVLKSKEAGLSTEQVDGIWNATAERFRKVEAVLKVAGDAELYTACEQNSRAMSLGLVPGMGGPLQPPLRKKEF
jgi:hypothetical protein